MVGGWGRTHREHVNDERTPKKIPSGLAVISVRAPSGRGVKEHGIDGLETNVRNQRGAPMKKPPTTQEQAAPGAVEMSGRRLDNHDAHTVTKGR